MDLAALLTTITWANLAAWDHKQTAPSGVLAIIAAGLIGVAVKRTAVVFFPRNRRSPRA